MELGSVRSVREVPVILIQESIPVGFAMSHIEELKTSAEALVWMTWFLWRLGSGQTIHLSKKEREWINMDQWIFRALFVMAAPVCSSISSQGFALSSECESL